MNVAQFQQKWRLANLKEKSAAQEHFIDLCRLLGVPTPAEADPDGAFFTFEAGAGKAGGGDGFADVFYRGRFAWEYKGRHADLEAAYKQVLLYKDALHNPPLLVVCDLIRFVVKTNFTGTVTETYEFTIDDLSDPLSFGVLRNAFTDPEKLRPEKRTSGVTEQAAERFGQLALDLTARGHDPAAVAHFLVQVLFCLVAEDMGLLERGLFTDLLAFGAKKPDRFPAQAAALFAAMRDGGDFNLKEVPRFNGGLFAAIDPLPFSAEELRSLAEDAAADWSQLEPSIFGTLFERSLDPARRSQLGAHYTGREDILRVVEPVILAPLRREWLAVRAEAERLAGERDAAREAGTTRLRDARQRDLAACLGGFQDRLAAVTVLDPACGSGNFLYVALEQRKRLEGEVLNFLDALGDTQGRLDLAGVSVDPHQLLGLELNPRAAEVAEREPWTGYLQWHFRTRGNVTPPLPVLKDFRNIECRDAVLAYDRVEYETDENGRPVTRWDGKTMKTHPVTGLDVPDESAQVPVEKYVNPRAAEWPQADFVVGNPPFIGKLRIREALGSGYVEALRASWPDVPESA
ncbi:MAG: DNA methyltransferase, partial [Chloroflexota bacterium]